MNTENLNRLKKYLFLISLFFALIFGGHILYVYLYNDAIEKPIEGGSVSEGVIGDFAHLNPLLNSNDYNDNILHMLYRSLLSYDYKTKQYVGDIAECDTKNLSNIKCFLKRDIKWSSGEDIKVEDVLATYNILKNSNINPMMSSLLKDVKIDGNSEGGVVTFASNSKDVNFLPVLTQKIVSKNILDNIGNKELYGKFNPIDGIYSGPYKVDTISYNDSLGIKTLILSKNENFKEYNVLIKNYIYKFFTDISHFLKHKDIVNVFFDENNIATDTIPRLDSINYYGNNYLALFLNADTIKDDNLREFILSKVDVSNIIKTLGKSKTQVLNPYLLENINIGANASNINLENLIKGFGFYKKDYLTALFTSEAKKQNETQKINTQVNPLNANLTYLIDTVNKKYNFISNDNLLIKGAIKEQNPSEIYINDYKLISYKSGDKNFYFRLKTEFKNMSEGENNYKLYFVVNGEKKLMEEFVIYYYTDKNKLSDIEKKLLTDNTTAQTNSGVTSSGTTSTGVVSTGTTIDNSAETTALEEAIKQKMAKIDGNWYYDRNLNKFSLRLYYIDDKKDLPQIVNIIKNTLETYSIYVEPVAISISDLNSKILAGKKDYDMILAGIDLGNNPYNIYPYFHSSQSKDGYNFSNIKNLNLDILLEELKSNVLTTEKRLELEKKVLDILKQKQVVKTIYQNKQTVLIDKNIKSFVYGKYITGPYGIIDSVLKSYITSEKQIKIKEKNFGNFIKFIKTIFKNEQKS